MQDTIYMIVLESCFFVFIILFPGRVVFLQVVLLYSVKFNSATLMTAGKHVAALTYPECQLVQSKHSKLY